MLKRFGSTNNYQDYRFFPSLAALLLCCFALLLSTSPRAFQTDKVPPLTASTQLSKEGYVTLSVDTSELGMNSATSFAWLEQSLAANFNTVQKRYPLLGDSAQITVSGLANESYWFRFTDEAGTPLTKPVQVTVEHYPLAQAFAWFSAGALLFLLLLWLLLNGHRQAMLDSSQSGAS